MDDEETIERLKIALDFVPVVKDTLKKWAPRDGEVVNLKPIEYPLFVIYARCRSLYEGSIILTNNNLAEEALILSRSLLEESSRLAEIFNSDNKRRAEYLAGWIRNSINNRRSILLSDRDKPDEFKLRAKTSLDKEARSLSEMMKKEGVQSAKSFPKTDVLIKRHFKDDYFAFQLGNQMTHGYLLSQSFRTVRTDLAKGGVFYKVHIKYDNPLAKLINLYISMIAILWAHTASAKILGWSGVDFCKKLIDEIREIGKILDSPKK